MSSTPLELACFVLAALLYAGAGVAAARSASRGRRYPHLRLLIVVGLGFVLQSAALYTRGMRFGGCPVGNPFELLQFLSWSVILFYFVFGPTFRVSLLGLFSSLLAGSLTVLSLAVPAWDATRRAAPAFGGNPWVEAHASLALVSYGAFGVLALMGAMYLLQHAALKHKRARGVFGLLPSVVQLDDMSWRVHFAGLAGLSVALVIAFAGGLLQGEGITSAKLGAVLLVWLLALVLQWLRWRRGLRGPAAAWASMALFAVALLSLVPVDHARPAVRSADGTAPVSQPPAP